MDVERRQIWARPTSTTSIDPSCTPFLLPSNGILSINNTYTLTISHDVVYQPVCTGNSDNSDNLPSAILNTKDPFSASVGPQLYAIGCMTVVSYLLVIILLITPRTFYIGGPGGGGNFLGRHGMISGSYSGSSSIVGVGGRPWLQKVAALTVAISLTIATVDSFRVAERQYASGYTDATALTQEVIDGTEIRIVRVISSTFLWLAQVQTLIRLFPRHKEKVMIKWAGFALIVLDTIFSILDNFVSHGSNTRPRLFDDAIPALSYLFELALNLLYAAWVIFYSLSKHRFAFFHPKMRNICLVAALSLIVVCIPVIFFIMDIASPDVAGWGEYIRWVGSAAASVVVWEWVERIEALERDERKDGILGREVFDGDEMLEVTPSTEVDWAGGRGNDGGRGTGSAWGGVIGLNHRPLRRNHLGFQLGGRSRHSTSNANANGNAVSTAAGQPTRPPAAVTPISRADTTSAASTVYYVRYHPVTTPTPPIPMVPDEHEGDSESQHKEADTGYESRSSDRTSSEAGDHNNNNTAGPWTNMISASRGYSSWLSAANIFKRRRTSPPQEVVTAQEQEQEEDQDAHGEGEDEAVDEKDQAPPNIQTRMQNILSSLPLGSWQSRSDTRTQRPLTVTVIPPRDRSQQMWSPQRTHDTHEPAQPQNDTHDQTNYPARVTTARVTSTQVRRAAPWGPSPPDSRRTENSPLVYDPETAALVGVGPEFSTSTTASDRGPPNSARGTSSGDDTLVVPHQVQRISYESSSPSESLELDSDFRTGGQTGPLLHPEERDLEAGTPPLQRQRRAG